MLLMLLWRFVKVATALRWTHSTLIIASALEQVIQVRIVAHLLLFLAGPWEHIACFGYIRVPRYCSSGRCCMKAILCAWSLWGGLFLAGYSILECVLRSVLLIFIDKFMLFRRCVIHWTPHWRGIGWATCVEVAVLFYSSWYCTTFFLGSLFCRRHFLHFFWESSDRPLLWVSQIWDKFEMRTLTCTLGWRRWTLMHDHGNK